MDVVDLLKAGRNAIRNSDDLSLLFNQFFVEFFGREASFCCTFQDFDTLNNHVNYKKMGVKKEYKVLYKPHEKLFFVKDKKVYRMYAKDATDFFVRDFIEHHDSEKFKDVDEKIIKLVEKNDTKNRAAGHSKTNKKTKQ